MISALDMQRARAGAIARELVARSPSGSIACIFVGGSLGRGEVWAAEIVGQLEVYSDLDMYAVVRDVSRIGAVSAAARAVCAAPPAIDGARFLRAPEIGVYSAGDLRSQPARPGTVDLATHHLLLHGDRPVPDSLPGHDHMLIAPAEALYLLENRLMELADEADAGEGGQTRLELMLVLKARLDVHAAHAIVAGSFVPTFAARAQRFQSDPPPTLDAAARDAIAAAYRAAEAPASWLRDRDLGLERETARRALSRAWRTLAAVVPETTGGITPEAMVARRARTGARRANAREVVRLRRHTRVPMWRAITAALFLSGRSPRCTLRLDALVRQLRAEGLYGDGPFLVHQRHLDRLTRMFGFTGGALDRRVRDMHRTIS